VDTVNEDDSDDGEDEDEGNSSGEAGEGQALPQPRAPIVNFL
jgi:hypothetical protein